MPLTDSVVALQNDIGSGEERHSFEPLCRSLAPPVLLSLNLSNAKCIKLNKLNLMIRC